ncbi:hypothetical protein VTH82DRAFT_7869 [Thermothelomyces myriococcoides]
MENLAQHREILKELSNNDIDNGDNNNEAGPQTNRVRAMQAAKS